MPPRKAKKAAGGKYPSKVVGEILESVIEGHLRTVKQNPKTTAKWMEKMKFSVLKKLSGASKVAFAVTTESGRSSSGGSCSSGVSVESLQAEVGQLRGKIQQQVEHVRRKVTAQLEKADYLPSLGTLSEAESTYVTGRYVENVRRIKAHVETFAPLIGANIRDMPDRLLAFQTSMQSTKTDWKSSSVMLQQRAAASGAPIADGAASAAAAAAPTLKHSKAQQQALKDKQGPADALASVLAHN